MKLERNTGIAVVLLCISLADAADAGINEWTSQGPNGGYVYALAIDPATPSTLYAGTAASGGGVYKSTDGGDSWAGAGAGLPGLEVYALAVDPAAPSTVYCGTLDGGVYKSTDGGENWTGTFVGIDYGRIAALAIDPTVTSTLYAGAAYAGTGGGVYKSTDGGDSWTAINSGLTSPDVTALAIDRTHPEILYAGTGGGVFKSTDGGGHWAAANNGLTSLGVHALVIDPFDDATLYAGGSGVYKTTDGGASWTAVNNGLELDDDAIPAVETLAIDPITPGTVYAGAIWGYGGVYKSTDGGGGWVALDVAWLGVDAGLDEPDVRALAIDPADPSILYAGTSDFLECRYYSAGVYQSADGGANWAVANAGLSSTRILDLAIDPAAPSNVWAGIAWGGSAWTADGGVTWNRDDGDSWITALAIDPSAPPTRYSAFAQCERLPEAGMTRITDGGSTDISLDSVYVPTRQLIIDPMTPATLYAVAGPLHGDAGTIYRSPDRGDTWTALTTGLPAPGVTVLAIDRLSTRLRAGTSEGVFISTDGGDSWTAASSGLADAAITALAIDPEDPEVAYAGTAGGVFKSTGDDWFATGLTDTSITALAIDPLAPATVYAGTGGDGVFKSTDGGASWVSFGTGLESLRIRTLAIDPLQPATLYAATDRGVFDLTQVAPCRAGATATCLNAGRFRVEVDWRSFDGTTGSGRVVPFGSEDSGLFWFFEADNWEFLVKVLDGCAINDRFWVFAAATTTVEVTLRVTDTETGATAEYFNPLGNAADAITDTGAFATCSAAARRSLESSRAPIRSAGLPEGDQKKHPHEGCVPSATRMCLSDDRFSVEVEWRDYAGNLGSGKVVGAGSADSGLFWFFNGANWEMLVKVLDACHLDDPHFLMLAAATTDVEYTLRVTDTETGDAREYFNPLGNAAAALVDTFDTCP